MTTKEIKDYLISKGTVFQFNNNNEFEITRISSLQNLQEESICWIKSKKFATDDVIRDIKKKRTVLVVCPFEIESVNCIITQYPKGVFFDILNQFFSKGKIHEISEKAVIFSDKIGNNVHIGANCFIGDDVTIGDNTIIHPNVSIISPCVIGHDCEIYPGVVIGTDGFGYFFEEDIPYREKHFMGVKIGDYVDIGANVCIDRGLITDTEIRSHVKIDNLCHIGHNVVIEENCLVIAGTIICGSAWIKKNAYLSPGSVVLNQIIVEEKAKVGSNSLAISTVRAGSTVLGVPGKRITS